MRTSIDDILVQDHWVRDEQVEGKLVELRVHGVSGTPPESMLGDPFPLHVSGDDVGRVMRRRRLKCSPDSQGRPQRVVEAFHWGRFTAGSPTRALWLLLLPFALVNLARFALLSPQEENSRRRFHSANETLIRLLGLCLTLTMVSSAAYVAWDVVAAQCGDRACAAGGAEWLSFYLDRPLGVRFAIAAIVPALTIAVMWVLGARTFDFAPPDSDPNGRWASKIGSFGDRQFWEGAKNAATQRAAHVSAACGLLGLLALASLSPSAYQPTWLFLYVPVLAGCVYGLVVGVLLVYADPAADSEGPRQKLASVVGKKSTRLADAIEPAHPGPPDGLYPLPWVSWSRRLAAAAAVVAVTLTALRIDPMDAMVTSGGSVRPGLVAFETVANVVALCLGALLLALLVGCRLAAKDAKHRHILRTGPERDRNGAEIPAAFRPFWRGFGAWMLAALSAMLGSGYSMAVVFWVGSSLSRPVAEQSTADEDTVVVAASYWTGALLWGAVAVLAGVSLLPMVALVLRGHFAAVVLLEAGSIAIVIAALLRYGTGHDFVADAGWYLAGAALLILASVGLCVHAATALTHRAEVEADYHPEDRQAARMAITRAARRWRLAAARHRYQHVVGFLALMGGVLVLLAGFVAGKRLWAQARGATWEWSDDLDSSQLTSLGAVVVTAIAAGLIALGVATWRRPTVRTATGILWDLISFWPRAGHPLCPPPYGGRAVLGVVQRTDQLQHDLGARKVVLSGHSQGSLITLAAAAVLAGRRKDPIADKPEHTRTIDETAMVTYGSQLQFIYSRLFPSFVGFAAIRDTFNDLGERWINIYRGTDPLGGPVLDRLHAERDVRWPDPDVIAQTPRRPRSSLRGHSDYYADPEFDSIVAKVASLTPASAAAPSPPAGSESRPPALWPDDPRQLSRRWETSTQSS